MSASADPRGTVARTKVVGTPQERAQALHDLSVAYAELGQLGAAARTARQGLRLAPARFHLLLAWIDLDRGATKSSQRHLDAAMPGLSDRDLARARTLRGLHLCQSAEPRLAIAELSAVMRELRRHGDDRWLANAMIGRGIARSYALRLAEADADFTGAHTLLVALGEPGRAAMCLHNKGFVAMLAGQLPRALACFEQAAREGLDSTSRPEALLDRAEALLTAGLVDDAHRILGPALTLLRGNGRGSRLPEATLLAARCALRLGHPEEARTHADEAARLFRAQGRQAWVPAAKALEAELRFAAGDFAAVSAQRFKGPAYLRVLGWLARAQSPDRREALHACRAGLRVVDEYRAALTTTWPAAALTTRALDLASTPREVLRWAERHRANQLAHPELHPPDDPGLADTLTALRRARAMDEPIETLERDVRRRTLAAAKESSDEPFTLPDRLVSCTLHRGQLKIVTVDHGRARLTTMPDPVDEVDAARLAPDAGTALDRLVPGDDYVVVPDGALMRMPWSALNHRVCVVPSIRHWHRARRRPSGTGTAWITGPGLTNAAREVRELQEEHGGQLLQKSTVDEVLRAMDGVHLVHIAAHGHVRTDHPLFSCLQLDDGPLYGYDLNRLGQAPEIVVLSACDSGLARVFLDQGTRVVIASVLPVPDRRARPLMAALHRELHRGAAEAVRLAQRDHGNLGFTCFGAG